MFTNLLVSDVIMPVFFFTNVCFLENYQIRVDMWFYMAVIAYLWCALLGHGLIIDE